ncbi:MAG: alpha-L-fucosidase [Bacteroidota bacterium]
MSLFVFSQTPPKPYGALPSERQLRWQETEMYCIVHFSVATYTDKEWGYGDEDPALFNPGNFNAMDIVAAAKAGGFKGIVVVAKHHDGFCLWPTKTTPHNITKSPYKNGKGDIVKEYQVACNKLGMKMAVYCSPWDRNSPIYGKPEYVSEVYREQLRELYANYGPVFMSWHDGANGGDGYYDGAREVRKIDQSTYYNWPVNWAITRKMQPGAAIFGDIGPDVRWVGNEEGHAGETSWATFTPEAPDAGKEPSNGYSKYWLATEGTRNGKFWMPAECDVPMRPGWFYHQSEDGRSKSAYALVDLYYKSVGRGACLDLGLSPDKNGRLTSEDVAILKQFGQVIKQTFSVNLAKPATFTSSNTRGNAIAKFGPVFLTDSDRYSYWATDDKVQTPQLIADLHQLTTFNVIRLRENIKLGQRVSAFAVDAWKNGNWKEIASGTSIGANRLIRLPQNVATNKVRVRITASAASVALSDFGLFKEPVHLEAPSISRDKNGYVVISTNAPVESIHYTLDGTDPTTSSLPYSEKFELIEGGNVKARAFESSGKKSEVTTFQFGLLKSGWKIMDTVSQARENNKPENAIDDNPNTFWSTLKDTSVTATFPQEISIDMGKPQTIKAFLYLPRQDKKTAGIADSYIIYTSDNGITWQQVTSGEFANIRANPIMQEIPLTGDVTARYFKLSVPHVLTGNGMTVAELGVRIK